MWVDIQSSYSLPLWKCSPSATTRGQFGAYNKELVVVSVLPLLRRNPVTIMEDPATCMQSIEALTHMLADLGPAVSSLSDGIKRRDIEIACLKKTNTEMESLCVAKESLISSLQNSITTGEKINTNKDRHIASLENNITYLNEDITNKEARIMSLMDTISSKNNSILSLESDADFKEGSITSLEDQVNIKEAIIRSLEDNITTSTDDVNTGEDAITDLQDNITALRDEVIPRQGTIKYLENDNIAKEDNITSLEKEDLRSQNAPLKEQMKTRNITKMIRKLLKHTVVAGLFIILCLLYGGVLHSTASAKESYCTAQRDHLELTRPAVELKLFAAHLNTLHTKFPAQESLLWLRVRAVIKQMILHDTPVVVLFGSSGTARQEADCIALHISRLLGDEYKSGQHIFINASEDYAKLTPGNAKTSLEASLMNGFRGGAKTALITGLEDMHAETAILLHAFCDSKNAPFRKVAIFFTVHVDDLDVTDSKAAAGDIEDYLSEMWEKSLSSDVVNALVTNVANNIVVVRSETMGVMRQYC